MKHLLKIKDLSRSELDAICWFTTQLKGSKKPEQYAKLLSGYHVGLLWEGNPDKSSILFSVVVKEIGGNIIDVSQAEQNPNHPQFSNWVEELSQTCHGLVTYKVSDKNLSFVGEDTIPVINSMSDDQQPFLTLVEYFTLCEKFKGTKELKIAYVGDGKTPSARSLVELGEVLGIQIHFSSPPNAQPDSTFKNSFILHEDPREAVQGSHAIYFCPCDPQGEILGASSLNGLDDSLVALAFPDALMIRAHSSSEMKGLSLFSTSTDVENNFSFMLKAILSFIIKTDVEADEEYDVDDFNESEESTSVQILDMGETKNLHPPALASKTPVSSPISKVQVGTKFPNHPKEVSAKVIFQFFEQNPDARTSVRYRNVLDSGVQRISKTYIYMNATENFILAANKNNKNSELSELSRIYINDIDWLRELIKYESPESEDIQKIRKLYAQMPLGRPRTFWKSCLEDLSKMNHIFPGEYLEARKLAGELLQEFMISPNVDNVDASDGKTIAAVLLSCSWLDESMKENLVNNMIALHILLPDSLRRYENRSHWSIFENPPGKEHEVIRMARQGSLTKDSLKKANPTQTVLTRAIGLALLFFKWDEDRYRETVTALAACGLDLRKDEIHDEMIERVKNAVTELNKHIPKIRAANSKWSTEKEAIFWRARLSFSSSYKGSSRTVITHCWCEKCGKQPLYAKYGLGNNTQICNGCGWILCGSGSCQKTGDNRLYNPSNRQLLARSGSCPFADKFGLFL